MTKTISETEPTIESLLEQRTQYEEWLARLDASGDKVPPAVRQRVRGDYESRLKAVLEQLRGRGASVAEELERQHATQAQLDQERRAAEEALAEAEVRHAVGEYSEDEWRRLSEQSRREIDQLRGRLRSIGSEITRLNEVQALVAAPRSGSAPAPAAVAAPVSPPARKPEVVEEAPLVTHVADEPMDETPAPRATAKTSAPEAAPVDELAFLKSVSDEDHRPATRRPSNPGMAAVSTPTQRVAEPVVAAPSPSPKAASGVAKTLKCGECGTLNRPTEWYCERCGAELAGV
jgi:hypothetical protein